MRSPVPRSAFRRTQSQTPSFRLFASAKPKNQTSCNPQIVLVIIHSVVETRQIIVSFKRPQGNVPGEPNIESTPRSHGEGVRRPRQSRAAGTSCSSDSDW